MDAAVKFPTTPKPVKASALKLSKRMSVEQAFQAIARNAIDQMVANQAGAANFHDMESLHQMRVGLRRLDAALDMFDEVLAAPADIASELHWLMDQLGPARDWDVLLAETLPRVEDVLPETAALDQVRSAAQAMRQATQEQVSVAISSLRYKKLMNMLEHWLDQRGWRDDLSPKGKLRLKLRAADFADNILAAEQQRLLKRGRRLREASSEERHRVRIAAKRARYAAEFFASLYPGKQVRPYVAALTALQRELGLLNDCDVAKRLLEQLGEGNAGLRESTALVCAYLAACEQHGVPKVRRVWKKLAPVGPPHSPS